MTLQEAIAKATSGRSLEAEETAVVFGAIMDGAATPAQIGALLIALRMKGEAVSEIVGAAQAMRQRATIVPGLGEIGTLCDTCGTGGDGRATINVSTIAAIVAAAGGSRVAKHGNRAVSSRSGSADVLEALGVGVGCTPEVASRCLREVGIAFFFAPAYHGATKHAAGPRKELGLRTLFNLLGPLTNPANARRHVIGVFDGRFCEPLARALGELGSERALVVHGTGGFDEIATAGVTEVAELEPGGAVRRYEVSPADFGLGEQDPAGLLGGDAATNAQAARAILSGETGAGRAAVVMAAAAAHYVTGVAGDLKSGARLAEQTIDDGRASALLERWKKISREQ